MVEIADETGVPLTVVKTAVRLAAEAEEEAKSKRDDYLNFDSVWAVFDVDQHPNLKEAQALALHHGIRIALSNPCFELWALLHFQDQNSHIERGLVASRLRTHICGYNKLLPYALLAGRYRDAVSRASSLCIVAEHHSQKGGNPSTSVHELTELIRTK